jgi:hypothetical protein
LASGRLVNVAPGYLSGFEIFSGDAPDIRITLF